MKIVYSIADYYKEIRLAKPFYPDFHVGRHEDNISTIKKLQSPIWQI